MPANEIKRKDKERLARKNYIIIAAERIFTQKGFENSTMDDIAKEAEFTKKTIYSYFKSKETLYYEIMLQGFKTLNALYDKVLSKNIELGEIKKIKLIGYTFLDFSKDYPGYFKAISNYENKDSDFQENEAETLVKDCYEAGQYSFELLSNCIINGIKKGEISDEVDPEATCLILWASIAGFIDLINKKTKYVDTYFNKSIDEIMETGFEMLLNTIKKT
ncbi:MAG: TetR/AcrR family transcriptional regulator [Ruminiclostridium sp.]